MLSPWPSRPRAVETAPGRSSAPWPQGPAAVSFEHQGAGRMGQNWGETSENVGKPMGKKTPGFPSSKKSGNSQKDGFPLNVFMEIPSSFNGVVQGTLMGNSMVSSRCSHQSIAKWETSEKINLELMWETIFLKHGHMLTCWANCHKWW